MWSSLRLATITIHLHLLGLIVLSDEIICQGSYFMLGPGVSIGTLWLVFFGPQMRTHATCWVTPCVFVLQIHGQMGALIMQYSINHAIYMVKV